MTTTPPAPPQRPAPPAPAGAGAPGSPPGPTPSLGDGTTFATRTRSRWRAWRWPVLAVAVTLIAMVGLSLLEPGTSTTPLAPDNPGEDGARAVAQVLGDQGVSVEYVRSFAEVRQAAGPGVTVMVVDPHALPAGAADLLADSGADLALFEPTSDLLAAASDGRVEPARAFSGGSTVRAAQCQDPDAVAAEAITSSGAGYRATDADVSLCFPLPDGDPDVGSYAALTRADGAHVAVVDSAAVLTNAAIVDEGNAALALRMLGRNATLVWYQPVFDGDEPAADTRFFPTLPASAPALVLLAGAVTVAAMLWRGRRLGPVVAEPLPVVVQSAETTLGRGRLYRRSRSYGHAAAGLRAGAAGRLAARVGLPRSASAEALIDALTRATDRPAASIHALLYGPPPTDDDQLVRLTLELDLLESEVYHP